MNEITKIEPGTVAKVQTTAITPMSMLQMAVEQGADLDKMQKLMDLQERWEANEAKKAYIIAMSDFRANCPAIDKTRDSYNGKYAGLAETLETVKGILSSTGLSHSWEYAQSDNSITVTCTVTHIGGHQKTNTLSGPPDKSGNKNAIQAIASTVSYLERYTFFGVFGLASKDQDDDGQGADDIPRLSADQQANINDLLTEIGMDTRKFLGWIRADSLDRIRADEYDRCVKALEKKRKQPE